MSAECLFYRYLGFWCRGKGRPKNVSLLVFLDTGIRICQLGCHQVSGEFYLEVLEGQFSAEHLMEILPAHEEGLVGPTGGKLRQDLI
jgi:hypothetical protein